MTPRRQEAAAGPPSFLRRIWNNTLAAENSSLLRNGYALIASAGLTSVLGLFFWGLAARFYSAEQVGVGAALISTMLTIGNIAQLNLGNLLNRYLPSAGASALRLVLTAYALAATAAAIFSTVTVIFIAYFVAELDFLREKPLSAAAFIVATMAWTLFALQDSVLAGLRRATVVPLENMFYSAAKLALLALFAGSSLLGSGLYAAWILPLPLLLAAINWLIFFRFLPRHRSGGEGSLPGRRAMAHFFGWDYAGTLASMVAMGVAPLVVLHQDGAASLAIYYICWEIAYGAYLISRSMGISLLAEAAFDRAKLHRLAIEALLYTMAPLVGLVLILLIGAPLLLTLLGAQYSEASPALLRVLALSCLPWSLVTLILAVARATGRTEAVAVAQVTTLAIVLGLGTPLVASHGATGMAVAWLVAHCFVATGLLVDLSLRLGRSGRIELALHVLSALARLRGNLAPRHDAALPPLETAIAGFCTTTGLGAAESGSVREFPRESDVRTGIFRLAGNKALLIFKTATSPEGSAALARHMRHSRALAESPALTGLPVPLSRIVAVARDGSGLSLAEKAWPGEDGRAFLADPKRHFQGLRRAIETAGDMHARTATLRTIDESWLQRWIGRGMDDAGGARFLLLDRTARTEALAVFYDRQRRFWAGRTLRLGLGHGDLFPGNLLFAADTADTREPKVRLAAIIDWEAASPDAPPAIDAMFLLLTARAMRSGEELGFVVRRMLEDPRLSPEEEQAMRPLQEAMKGAYGGVMDAGVIRALCGLAWWRHVVTNLGKAGGFTEKTLWIAINLDLVLAWYGERLDGRPQAIAIRWYRTRKSRRRATQTRPAHCMSANRASKG